MTKKNKILLISSNQHFIDIFLLDFFRRISKKNEINFISKFESQNFGKDSISRYNIPISRKMSPILDICSIFFIFIRILKIRPNLFITVTPKSALFGIIIKILFPKIPRVHIYTGFAWTNFSKFKKTFFIFIDKLNILTSNKVLFDSQCQIDLLNKEKIYNNKFHLIGNGSIKGIDSKIFYKYSLDKKNNLKEKYGIPLNHKIILYLGRMDPDKGVLTLIECFKNLLSKNNNIFLLLVGRDEMNIKKYLNDILQNLSNKACYISNVSNPEDIINVSDIFCLPSKREGFGSVIIEAGACEIPVIGSDIYGLKSSLKNNFNGLTFKVDDINDLESKIQKLIDDKSLSKILGANGKNFANKNFSKKYVYECLENLIFD